MQQGEAYDFGDETNKRGIAVIQMVVIWPVTVVTRGNSAKQLVRRVRSFVPVRRGIPWWRHGMEMFSTLLAL